MRVRPQAAARLGFLLARYAEHVHSPEPGRADLVARIHAGPPFPAVVEIIEEVQAHGSLGFQFGPNGAEIWRYLIRVEEESRVLGFPLDTGRTPYSAEFQVATIAAAADEHGDREQRKLASPDEVEWMRRLAESHTPERLVALTAHSWAVAGSLTWQYPDELEAWVRRVEQLMRSPEDWPSIRRQALTRRERVRVWLAVRRSRSGDL